MQMGLLTGRNNKYNLTETFTKWIKKIYREGFFGSPFCLPESEGGEDSGTERKKTEAYGGKGAGG